VAALPEHPVSSQPLQPHNIPKRPRRARLLAGEWVQLVDPGTDPALKTGMWGNVRGRDAQGRITVRFSGLVHPSKRDEFQFSRAALRCPRDPQCPHRPTATSQSMAPPHATTVIRT
jgi:hypothetical protein